MGRNVWVYVMTEALTWWMKKKAMGELHKYQNLSIENNK